MIIYSVIVTALLLGLVGVEIYREKQHEAKVQELCNEKLDKDIRLAVLTDHEMLLRIQEPKGYAIQYEPKGCAVYMEKDTSNDLRYDELPAHILIKCFLYGDDPAFARLLAQELCDKLNESY